MIFSNWRKRGPVLALALLVVTGCRAEGEQGADVAKGPIVVLAAGSLARPMRAALDSFSARSGVGYTLESAGSLELARRFTELGKSADVLALADEDVFPKLLMPRYVTWYARFARNRLVLAHRDAATGIARVNDGAWRQVLTEPGVEVGRADPDLDPAGYRTLLLFQLAEGHFAQPGLARALEASAPKRHVRPKSAELVALVQAGELDYAWMYESSARGARLPFVTLPSEIDLGDEARAAQYELARVRVLGAQMGDTIEMLGAPIRYGLSIPVGAQHPSAAQAFLSFLYSADGQRVLRQEFLDATGAPRFVGTGVPPELRALADTVAVSPGAPGAAAH
ncbi:MAG: extracellular solute-binding protein [Gemmatimonadaceae bacterium]